MATAKGKPVQPKAKEPSRTSQQIGRMAQLMNSKVVKTKK